MEKSIYLLLSVMLLSLSSCGGDEPANAFDWNIQKDTWAIHRSYAKNGVTETLSIVSREYEVLYKKTEEQVKLEKLEWESKSNSNFKYKYHYRKKQ